VLLFLEGNMRINIKHGAKLIVDQLDCLYRHLGANSDDAAWFLICTSLISQQIQPMYIEPYIVLYAMDWLYIARVVQIMSWI
jgi:hypothetical protein